MYGQEMLAKVEVGMRHETRKHNEKEGVTVRELLRLMQNDTAERAHYAVSPITPQMAKVPASALPKVPFRAICLVWANSHPLHKNSSTLYDARKCLCRHWHGTDGINQSCCFTVVIRPAWRLS